MIGNCNIITFPELLYLTLVINIFKRYKHKGGFDMQGSKFKSSVLITSRTITQAMQSLVTAKTTILD